MGPAPALDPVVMTPYGKAKLIYIADVGYRMEIIKVQLLSGEMVMIRIEDLGFDHFRLLPSRG